MLRVRRITEYAISSRHSRMTLHVSIYGPGSGTVSGWIWRDWRRLALVDAYLAALPGLLWERGDALHFVYAFGARALSRKVALDLVTIMQRRLAPRRRARKSTGKGRR